MSDPGMTPQPPEVRDAPERSRYELTVAGAVVGHADYRRADGVVTVSYVQTDPARRGQGLGGRLMDGLLADLRARGERVRPRCGYAASYIDQRPEHHDLLA